MLPKIQVSPLKDLFRREHLLTGLVDGWDLYRSDAIVIQNSYISNDDDCVSFKPNSTNVVVQNLVCTGSHGISVGSLGQYLGETEIAGKLTLFSLMEE
jgi:galacturan 1,4-alpha-galacturonidase